VFRTAAAKLEPSSIDIEDIDRSERSYSFNESYGVEKDMLAIRNDYFDMADTKYKFTEHYIIRFVYDRTISLDKLFKTDLETASKNITQYYDETGKHISTTNDSAKKAAKKLQTPAFLGYTSRTYSAYIQATTSIPVVTTKV